MDEPLAKPFCIVILYPDLFKEAFFEKCFMEFLWMQFQKLFYFIVYVQFCLPKGSFRFQLTHTFIIMYFYFSFLVYYLIYYALKNFYGLALVAMESFYIHAFWFLKKTFF